MVSKPEVEDTANLYPMIAKNTSLTGQSLQIGKIPFSSIMCTAADFVDCGVAVK